MNLDETLLVVFKAPKKYIWSQLSSQHQSSAEADGLDVYVPRCQDQKPLILDLE